MAFDSSQLVLVHTANGYAQYRYDTMDAHADVDLDGYFNNSDDNQNFAAGDLMDVIVWSTAIRTGTISTYGQHVCMDVTANSVNFSNVTIGVMTDSD